MSLPRDPLQAREDEILSVVTRLSYLKCCRLTCSMQSYSEGLCECCSCGHFASIGCRQHNLSLGLVKAHGDEGRSSNQCPRLSKHPLAICVRVATQRRLRSVSASLKRSIAPRSLVGCLMHRILRKGLRALNPPSRPPDTFSLKEEPPHELAPSSTT